MPKKIINLKGLTQMCKRHRSRMSHLVNEDKRLTGDYIDNAGHHYWSIESAQRIADIMQEHEREGKAGRGVRMELPRKRDKRRDGES